MSTIPTGTPVATNQADQTMPAQSTGNAGNVPEISLSQNAHAIPSHAQVLTVTPLDSTATIVPMTPQQIAAYEAPSITPPGQSLTITRLPSNANIRLMRPWEISALAPPMLKQPTALAFGPLTSCGSGGTEYKFEMQGVDINSPYSLPGFAKFLRKDRGECLRGLLG
jgi:hypothetical protein